MKNRMVLIGSIVGFVLCAITVEVILNGCLGIGLVACAFAVYWLGFRKKNISELPLMWHGIGIIYGFVLAKFLNGEIALMDAIGHNYMTTYTWFRYWTIVSLTIVCTLCLDEIFVLTYQNLKVAKGIYCSLLVINLMIYFILPISVMFENLEEYSFPVYTLFLANIGPFITAMLIEALVVATCYTKTSWIGGVVSGVLLGIYVQYMFLNGVIGQVAGASYDWTMDVPGTIINILIWIVLVALMLAVEYFSKNTQITRLYVPTFLLAIQCVSLLTQAITAPISAYQYRYHIFMGEEQYTVSSNENVIMFVLDSADNMFLKNIIEEGEYDFADFKDFVMYTNTCSVFDSTRKSLPQMMTGATYDSTPVDYVEAYQRMKDAGYTINYYGYEGDGPEDMLCYVDNYVTSKEVLVDYVGIRRDCSRLIRYLVVPNIGKKYVDIAEIDFTKKVAGRHMMDYHYKNEPYAQNLHLKINEDSEKYFIMEHLDGVHEPNVGNEIVTKYCFDIIKEYMRQLKDMGLYEQSTIIITADHGLHDDMLTFPFPTPSTPIFLIKMPHEEYSVMQTKDAPIYHTDILATIMKAMQLYGDDGKELFGKTIFDFGEDELRERSFYNHGFKTNIIYEYTYTGTTKDLERVYELEQYVIR